jgi:drug/metabolite transporter (DMT)-like permease
MTRLRVPGGRAVLGPLGRRARRLSAGTRGVLIVVTGVLVLSPDSLLIRLMTADLGTLLLLRGLFSLIGYLVLLQVLTREVARPRTWALSGPEIAMGCLMALANLFFVVSIVHANAALALVIIASAPAFTSVFSIVFGRERVAARTWIACLVVLLGVAGVFATEPQGDDLLGALAALGASLVLAATLVLRRIHPGQTLRPLALGAGLTALFAFPFAYPVSVSGSDLAIAALLGLVVLPVSLELIWRGPRYIAAPEVSLILLLEAILGPAWIWLALGEGPTLQAVLVGVVILGTLGVHSVLSRRAELSGEP